MFLHADPYISGNDGVTRSCDNTILTSTVTGQAVRLSGAASRVTPYSEAALMAAVTVAPTTIYFSVQSDFYQYSGGVYSSPICGTSINHASE